MEIMKKVILVVFALSGLMSNLFAQGTLSGTDINNSVTLDYQVGGISQDTITATDTGFVVDNKIDFTVDVLDTTIVKVTPGQTNAVLTYRLTNNGNSVQDFSLSDVPNNGNPFGETDNFDAVVSIYADADGNGVYESGTDTVTYIDELSPDTNVTIFMVTTIPSARVDGDVSEHTLVAQAAHGGQSGTQGNNITSDDRNTPDNPTAIDIVFADGIGVSTAGDGDKDGKYAASDAYKISLASMYIVKESCIISDPVNNTTNPHRIPGAVIRYMITIDNNGTNSAESVTIRDGIDSAIYENPNNILVSSGTCNCATGGGAGGAGTGTFASGTVTFDMGTIAGGNSSKCAFFDVEIK